MPIERKSAAIMFTDIAGYTEAMSESEQKALDMLRRKRYILKPLIKNHQGTYVKEIGDGTLSYFESGYNASACAKEFQKEIHKDELNIRIGIHIGDIVFKDGDVFGGGVNVASRLESIAPAGGVCVSKSVYDELSNQDNFDGVELGLQSLKGVGRLVEIYGCKGDLLTEPKLSDYQATEIQVHSDDEVPSIAIIPFKNKGEDKDVFYAYAISADLISDCSGAGLIRVESLDKIEKVENWDKLKADELASKVFVRYIASGTLWKMDNMFQLSIELYDTRDKRVIWSDRWQEDWNNLPSIKGNLSDGLLKALDTIMPKVENRIENINPEAYEYYLRGKYILNNKDTIEDLEISRKLFQKAIEIDDNLWQAKHLIANSYSIQAISHSSIVQNDNKALKIYKNNLEEAQLIDNKLWAAGTVCNIGASYMRLGDLDKAMDYQKQSIKKFEELDYIPERGIG
jgi:class 3 adenylate cyclase